MHVIMLCKQLKIKNQVIIGLPELLFASDWAGTVQKYIIEEYS